LKKRIPLKKSVHHGGGARVGGSQHEGSVSGPGSRKQSAKRVGEHLVNSYLGSAAANPKQSIESTFSHNLNNPNLQKYLK